MKLHHLLGVASVLSVGSTFANNLVTNGSFEQDVVSQKWTLLNSVTGWQRDGAQFEIQTNSLNIIAAQDGNQYIELDSTANYSMMQNITTSPNQSYVLSFYYSPRVEGDSDTNQAKVFWNGDEVANLNATQRGWQHYSINVTASSETTELKFTGTGESNSYGAFIDNVSVTGTVARTCSGGLFGINDYGSEQVGYVYYFDLNAANYSILTGLSHTASNIASKEGTLYFMEQQDKATKASKLWTYDLDTNSEVAAADTTSYPIYRSVVTPDGQSLRSTSKTYMYDFDLQTGNKSVLGKLTFAGEDFKHGDIAYSADNNVLYVLTGQALYTLDEANMSLDLIGTHGLQWASGIAIANNGTIYVSARNSSENAKIYTLNPSTAEASYVMDGPAHINDLTFVDSYCSE
ncbi:hypothetical protein PSECIP111951_03072 [Pseudoalteromonas holothuriae]|uniref:DUF642 domain-containing protein n=1 Tax=Pseudoalteromonas holothuriae TaxID=2963714 RepID=A0A9W4QZA5_9GAMM|nr:MULTISPECIES: DUF642 domain-containing protein [unclassified Pseudoalteromonas]CAH9059636.1 hypothetical protein PSECIP111854_02446 [Pseudoalteromonas sp. CIP111854]CAH9064199.1 hypothetical protein PSECIP111951_03072 [Pseudoalteromonas sp. CIP111951]